MGNLSGKECWPSCIENLGFTETNQSCNPGTLIVRLGYAIGGVIALFVAMAGAKRARALDDTARAQEQGNIEDRYKNAITQFGNENPSVRLAGAYGLYHLAIDNKDRRRNICDVLCVHIRGLTTSEVVVGKNSDGKEIKYSEKYKTKPSNEVQSILDLLTNKDKKKDFPFASRWINLANAYLNGANLIQAQLQWAKLIGAQLQGADLIQAQLQWAKLIRTHLEGSNLVLAQLQEAKLHSAQLQEADLAQAQLQGADLFKAQLQGANLGRAQLQGANLSHAQFQGANLNKTNFKGAFTQQNSNRFFTINAAIKQLESRKGKKDEIYNAIFSGGVTAEQLENFKKRTTKILDELAKIKDYNQNRTDKFEQEMTKVEEILKDNINKPQSTSIPSESITGIYPEAEANKVIKILNEVRNILEAVKKMPKKQ